MNETDKKDLLDLLYDTFVKPQLDGAADDIVKKYGTPNILDEMTRQIDPATGKFRY
jgi:hypothetical protein